MHQEHVLGRGKLTMALVIVITTLTHKIAMKISNNLRPNHIQTAINKLYENTCVCKISRFLVVQK